MCNLALLVVMVLVLLLLFILDFTWALGGATRLVCQDHEHLENP